MPHFDLIIGIKNATPTEQRLLKKQYKHNVQLYAQWSWNGELVPIDNLTELRKLNSSNKYAEQKLMESNNRL